MVKQVLDLAEDHMKKSLHHLENELVKIRAGKASPVMLEGVTVEYYGTPTPLSQVANVTAADARTLTIQPWERNMLAPIERAIIAANLGLNPSNDGVLVRVPVPALTEERRKDLVKQTKTEGEHAKVAIRSLRHEALDKIKKLVKEGVSEDEGKAAEKKVQELTDKYVKSVDEVLHAKEQEIMTV